MSNHWSSDYQKPNDFVELTLDDLKHAGWMAHEAEDYANAMDMHRAFDRRVARKHAILDLSEDLSEQGMILVPEADWNMAVISWGIHAARNRQFVPAAPSPGETGK